MGSQSCDACGDHQLESHLGIKSNSTKQGKLNYCWGINIIQQVLPDLLDYPFLPA